MVAVKADAYGHGAVAVARIAEKTGMDMFAVASLEEGAELRHAGIKRPILVLGQVLPEETECAVANEIMISAGNHELLQALSESANKAGKKGHFFVNVDTGMGRVGVYPPSAAANFIACTKEYTNLDLCGVFSHLSSVVGTDEQDRQFTRAQIETMSSIRHELETRKVNVPLYSMANSEAIFDLPQAYFDMVRPGIMVYGFKPSENTTDSINVEPAMTLKSKIVFLKRVGKGTCIGYDRTYAVPADNSLIATIPIGYADGYSRRLSNKGPVLINGKRHRVAGRISMDQINVDLGPDSDAHIGDEVVFFGKQGQAEIKVKELATMLDTIVHEIICGISKRVPRVWINGGRGSN